MDYAFPSVRFIRELSKNLAPAWLPSAAEIASLTTTRLLLKPPHDAIGKGHVKTGSWVLVLPLHPRGIFMGALLDLS